MKTQAAPARATFFLAIAAGSLALVLSQAGCQQVPPAEGSLIPRPSGGVPTATGSRQQSTGTTTTGGGTGRSLSSGGVSGGVSGSGASGNR